jgi:hypothetical protein
MTNRSTSNPISSISNYRKSRIVLALTLEVIVPSVLDTAVPPANQFQETYVEPDEFIELALASLLTIKPFEVNNCATANVASAFVASPTKYLFHTSNTIYQNM